MKRLRRCLLLAAFVFLLAVGICAGILIAYTIYKDTACSSKNKRTERAANTENDITSCPNLGLGSTNGPSSVFRPLHTNEINKVYYFLRNKKIVTGSGFRDNSVFSITPFPLNKEKVLKHLHQNQREPERYAHARIIHGGSDPPYTMEYKVGPLSARRMTAEPLYNVGDIHFNARGAVGSEFGIQRGLINRKMSVLNSLCRESFDGAALRSGLIMRGLEPPGTKANERIRRYSFNIQVPKTTFGFLLYPVPLTFIVNSTDILSTNWRIYDIYYLNQGPFDTPQDLLEAYNNNRIRKIKMTGIRNGLDKKVYPYAHKGVSREYSQKAPPRAYQPQGPRYTVTKETVTWMGWEFHVRVDIVRGPVLNDVRFLGKRIAYEIATSEVSLIYGSDSLAGNNILSDTNFRLASQAGSLIPTIDCPEHATTMKASLSRNSYANYVSMICIFESDGERALWRKKEENFAEGLRESYLVVRVPLPVGNYDYTIEWRFHLDGSLQTMAHAYGFLQAETWDPENPNAGEDKTSDAFGYRVDNFTHGAMHDHTFAFKVDLDVLGTKNSFHVHHWKSGTEAEASSSEGLKNSTDETYFVKTEKLQEETGLKIDMEHPQKWVVVNENQKNKWGVARGYEIVPMATGAQTVSDQHPSMPGLSFTKYHCAVTRYKQNEMHATDNQVQGFLQEPINHMDRYLNSEPIVNQDLVLWVSFGFLHLPTSEDFPETLQTGGGFWLRPYNYFDRSPLLDLQHYLDTADGCRCARSGPLNSKPCYG